MIIGKKEVKEYVLISWLVMAGYTILYGVISVIALEFVDKDKR